MDTNHQRIGVRQQGDIKQIPEHHLNHMTGGLENVAVDIGIIGDFYKKPSVLIAPR
jgi:hypothetical protein